MDTSKLKDITGKLGFFRDYSSLLLPIVIAVIGILLFVPNHMMSKKLKEKVARESVSLRAQKVKSLVNTAVADEQWKVEQQYQDSYYQDANQIAQLARQSSQRELLSYKIFPKPQGSSTLVFEEFGYNFQSSIEKLISNINGRDCPTDSDIEKSLEMTNLPSTGYSKGASQLKSERESLIRDEICLQHAENTSVYINPYDLSGYGFWEDYQYDLGMAETIEDCWYWQVGYWIIEDVILTIESLNSGSGSVFSSPVKRLFAVSFSLGESIESPFYVTDSGLTTPCTRRMSNEEIDVVHFYVSVLVRSKAILPFMKELCSGKSHKFRGFFNEKGEQVFKHNQITILKSQIESIDRESEEHSLYRYGEDAVFSLNLVCEYVFNRAGYDEIKPETIKGTEDTATATSNPIR
jgi:hypothetical protein